MENLIDEQALAVQLAVDGHNVFVGGRAGTGKSVVLETIIDARRSKGKVSSIYRRRSGLMLRIFPQPPLFYYAAIV